MAKEERVRGARLETASALNPILRVVDHGPRSMRITSRYSLLVNGTDVGQAVTPCSFKQVLTVLPGKRSSRACAPITLS